MSPTDTQQYRCVKCGNPVSSDFCPLCDADNRGPGDEPFESSSRRVGLLNQSIPTTTAQSIPGRDVVEVLGLVFGAGNAAWTIEGTAGRSATALGKAVENLQADAEYLHADAVVAITFSMDGSGSKLMRAQTITLLGTAVKLSPLK